MIAVTILSSVAAFFWGMICASRGKSLTYTFITLVVGAVAIQFIARLLGAH